MTRNINSALKYINSVSAFFGFYVGDPRKHKKNRKSLRKVEYLRCTGCMVLFVAALILASVLAAPGMSFRSNDIANLGRHAMNYSSATLAITILLKEILHHGVLNKILVDLENCCKGFSESINYFAICRVITTIFICALAIHFGFIINDFVIGFGNLKANTAEAWSMLFYLVYNYWALTILLIFVSKFSGICYIISQNFKILNCALEKFNYMNGQEQWGYDILVKHQIKSVRSLCMTHKKISAVSQKLNKLYDVQIILYVALVFILSVWKFYTVVLRFIDVNTWNGYGGLAITFGWIIFNLSGVVVLALTCHKIKWEAAKTAAIIHRIRFQNNPLVKEEIEIWSIYFLQHKLNFTAAGLFDIDMTLIYSIIASMSTYLVVLIQFNIVGSNSNSKYHRNN